MLEREILWENYFEPKFYHQLYYQRSGARGGKDFHLQKLNIYLL